MPDFTQRACASTPEPPPDSYALHVSPSGMEPSHDLHHEWHVQPVSLKPSGQVASEVLSSPDLCTGCEARAGGYSHGFFSEPMGRTSEAARGRPGR